MKSGRTAILRSDLTSRGNLRQQRRG